jgi:hypothetical protein
MMPIHCANEYGVDNHKRPTLTSLLSISPDQSMALYSQLQIVWFIHVIVLIGPELQILRLSRYISLFYHMKFIQILSKVCDFLRNALIYTIFPV